MKTLWTLIDNLCEGKTEGAAMFWYAILLFQLTALFIGLIQGRGH